MPKRYIKLPDGSIIETGGAPVDSTLSIKGAAADAAVVGEKVDKLSEEIEELQNKIPTENAETIALSGWTYGYITADGEHMAGGTGYTSDYVEVSKGNVYTIVYPATIEGVRFAVYDSNKTFIKRIIDGTYVYTATADGYIKITTLNAEGYTDVYLSVTKDSTANSCGCNSYDFLSGLKYYALGDSIVDMQGTLTAPETFGDTGYSKDLQNRDISGITVDGYVTAIERRYGLVATNFGKGGHTLVGDYSTLASMNYSDVALVTIAYGVNDARTGVPLGTVNSTDVTTFAGALNQLLRKIYTDNPECRVLVLAPLQRLTVTDFGISTPNANGNYLIDFVDMCHSVAEKRSTICIDQYRKCGINQTNLYYYTVEGVHPVNQGFARIKAAVIGALDELFALEYEPIGVMTNTGDTEPEEPDTGGDGGGDVTPPEEDTGATEVEVVSRLTKDGYYYDGYPSVIGKNIYKGIEFPLIELIDGKTYTLETYTESNTHGRFAAVSVDENAKAGTYLSGGASSTGNWVITAIADGVYKAVITFVAGTATVKVDGVATKCLYLSFGCLNDYVSQAKLSYV